MRYPATQTKAISYFSRQAIFWAELRSSHLPGCDWLAGLENTLNCRQYCRQICGSSNTISLLRIFGNPNKMLDWRTNPNLILLTNIRVCPSILYSDTDFITQSSWYNQEVIGPNREVRPKILGSVPGKVSVTGLSSFWTSW